MADIRGVGGIQPSDFTAPKVRRIQQPKAIETVQDQLQISATAVRATEIARVTELAKASPDIRVDVVEQAKARLESGEYLSEKVTQKVAEKILESLT
jgi:anti-sigma28 factor (negative regulator of flagellin synthesis)